jgi:hypothetical protein
MMEIPNGKCSSCGRMIPIWRCGETTGGGTYHIVCSECSARESQQSLQSTAVWQWIGWLLMAGFLIGTLFVVLVFGGH